MSHKASLGVAIFLGLLTLAGCGSFLTSKDSITGSEIYTVSSTQDESKPWIIHITVGVNTAARDALAATAGYKAPDKVHIWMGALSDYNSGLFSNIEMRPLATINVPSGFTTPITADVNLIDLAKGGSGGFSWLSSYDFLQYGYLKMSGYYLMGSDGWSYTSDSGKTYSLSGGDSHTFSFPDRFPVGQGISAVAPASPFIDILNPLGWHIIPANVNSVAVGDTVTLTYGSDSATANPYLYYYGGSAWGYIYAPATPTELSPNGKYVWTFTMNFSLYDGSTNYSVTNDGTIINVPINGSFNLYSQNTSEYYSSSFTVY